jgi:hypothetical protein
MVDEPRRPTTTAWGIESRPWRAPVQSDPSALIQSLQWLRERVLERLDSLEILARQQPASASAAEPSSDRERALERKRAELEEAERRLRTQAERQEQEWSAAIAQLEADRRLLAEAWERLERERIVSFGAPESYHNGHPQAQGPQRGGLAALPQTGALITARSVTADPDPNHPVVRDILRQFQTLCSDVRRNAEDRRDSC